MDHIQMAQQLVVAFATILHRNPAADDDAVIQHAVDAGMHPLFAEKLAVFVPLAFGRVLLQRMNVAGFSPTFQVQDEHGNWVERRLEAELCYTAALAVAEQTFNTGLVPRDVYQTVVQHSAEFALANDALNQGRDLAGARFSPPVVLRLSTTDFALLP